MWWQEDPEPVMTPGWKVYFGIVAFCAAIQVISMTGMLISAIEMLWRRLCTAVEQVSEPVAVIVPAFLPNEANIIKDTLRHLLEKMTHVDQMNLYLVYNTPTAMPIQQELAAMEQEQLPPGRRLIVQECHGSRSKAENLNYVVPQLSEKYCAVYDADHHPDEDSLAKAIQYLDMTGVDCVQGSTYIRKGFFLQRWLTNAEFFVNYFVVLPAMQVVSGTGFFGGANGVWRTSSMQKMQFDAHVLTEDIDCFARGVVEKGLQFRFLPECASGELLPAGPCALWSQRLRWAMGWDQVTARHASSFWTPRLSLRMRLGLYYIFVCRWFTQLGAIVVVLFNVQTAIQKWIQDQDDPDYNKHIVPPEVFKLQLASFGLYATFLAFALYQAVVHVLTASAGVTLIIGMLLYFTFMPLYVIWNSALLMVSLFRITRGKSAAWVVTSRGGGAGGESNQLSAPLIGQGTKPLEGSRVLAIGWIGQGAMLGCLVGAMLGQRKVVHPLWGFVPFGIGATVTTVTDGRIVALGVGIGVAASLATLPLTLIVCKRR